MVLRCENVNHAYGPKHVLHRIDIEVVRGQIVSLVGPSGCGKSTLLKSILGTLRPTSGRIATFGSGAQNGDPVRRPGRDRGIVYQRYALYPFMTALENVAFGLKMDETSYPFRIFRYLKWRHLRKEHLHQSEQMLDKVGLADAIHKYPHELSGGMQQRVAIAQAMVMKPEILLLDEPFGALDEATREDLQMMLLQLYAENVEARQAGNSPPYTILIVTHELNEAIYVGDRVLGLSQYWNWAGAGHSAAPGATIVYDKPAPIYQIGEARDYQDFLAQREEIRSVVFEPATPVDIGPHLTFWEHVKSFEHGVHVP